MWFWLAAPRKRKVWNAVLFRAVWNHSFWLTYSLLQLYFLLKKNVCTLPQKYFHIKDKNHFSKAWTEVQCEEGEKRLQEIKEAMEREGLF